MAKGPRTRSLTASALGVPNAGYVAWVLCPAGHPASPTRWDWNASQLGGSTLSTCRTYPPVPDKVALVEPPVAALTARVAWRSPERVGANDTPMVQLAPPARKIPAHVSDVTRN